MAASALARAGEKKSNARRKELAVVKRLRVIPHGVDLAFRPLPSGEKGETRMQLFRGKVRDDDFLMVNVNTNQRRKGVPQSLQILAELKNLREEGDPEFRLYLHMPRENRDQGICLGLVARQLGLIEGEDVFFGDPQPRVVSRHNVGLQERQFQSPVLDQFREARVRRAATGVPAAIASVTPNPHPSPRLVVRWSRVNASKSAELILEAVRAGYVRQCTEA
jgi:hypothetical protein